MESALSLALPQSSILSPVNHGPEQLMLVPCGFLTGYTLWSDTYDYEANPLIILDNERNPLRRRAIELAQSRGGTTALDLCCGTGRHITELEKNFPHVFAVDGCPAMLRRASGKSRRSDTAIWREDVLGQSILMDRLDGRCDMVVLALAAMHFQDLGALISRVRDLLSPGGVLHVVDAAEQFIRFGSKPHFVRQRGKIHVDHQIDHFMHSPTAFAQAVAENGLEILESTHVDFDDCYLSVNPYLRKYRGLRCLFAFNAVKRDGVA